MLQTGATQQRILQVELTQCEQFLKVCKILIEDARQAAEIQNLQLLQRLERRQSHACYRASGKPQTLQIDEQFEVFQARITDVRAAQVELFELCQAGEVAEARTTDPRFLHRQIAQILQALDVHEHVVGRIPAELQRVQGMQVGKPGEIGESGAPRRLGGRSICRDEGQQDEQRTNKLTVDQAVVEASKRFAKYFPIETPSSTIKPATCLSRPGVPIIPCYAANRTACGNSTCSKLRLH